MLINTAHATRWFLGVTLVGFLGSGLMARAGEFDHPAGATTELTQVAGDVKVRATPSGAKVCWIDPANRKQ